MDLNNERGVPFTLRLGAAVILTIFAGFLVLSFLRAVIK